MRGFSGVVIKSVNSEMSQPELNSRSATCQLYILGQVT